MATTWRDAQKVARDQSHRMRDAVLDALDCGGSAREVAAVIGVSPSRVYDFVARSYAK